MREKSNFGPMVIILIAAIGAGLLVGWLAVRSPKTDDPIVNPVTTVPPVQSETNQAVAAEREEVEPVAPLDPIEEVNAQNWDDRLNDILASDEDEDLKADKLADMIPRLPEAAQVEIAEHLVNLVSDEDYNKKTAKILLSPTIPASVSGVLFHDLMNRHDGLSLPLTLKIAKDPNHPLREEALETLEMSLVEEFGDDWDKWEKAINESLREQGLLDEEEEKEEQPAPPAASPVTTKN